ncbi:MAG TPA: OmpH family outer membrane protein [Vicinamibacterales bacterium]|jgi:outer membrane protein|nr:OmpH family outer membrane protein [Vicinamibacterales bacterium]
MRDLIVRAASAAVLSAAIGAAVAGQQPAQPAGTQPAPAAQPQPPRPFPEGAKIAYVRLQVVAQNSAEGKAASAKIDELRKKKEAELAEKNKQLQAAQQKLVQSGTVLSDQARSQLEKEIDRMQREIQFAQQNAQAEIQDLTQELQQEFFQKKLLPVIGQIGQERNLHVIFSDIDAGILWADAALDVTNEVIRRLDAAMKPAAPKPPGQ